MLTRSPKRTQAATASPSRWFGYYAGYSPDFVAEAIAHLGLQPDAIVADPWNGSGTTTEVAHERGLIGRGFDINPAIVLVAKARLLRSDIKPSHLSICDTILQRAQRLVDADFLPEEPLGVWFSRSPAATIRGIERSIQTVLIAASPYTRLAACRALPMISPLAAFFYVALFRTVRRFLGPFTTSNPTWIKDPPGRRARLRTQVDLIREAFRQEVRRMFDTAGPKPKHTLPNRTLVEIGDSTRIPLGLESVAAVVSSPPYCTRIDYAVATKPELAVLGATKAELQALRESMLGTPLTRASRPAPRPEWGPTCNRLLRRIKTHPSHASDTYYYNNHLQYFDRLYRSLADIVRILMPDGHCILVVQDSHYKEVHNDLPLITADMVGGLGLGLRFRRNHPLAVTKAAVNTRSQKYRKDSAATESVLVFAKA